MPDKFGLKKIDFSKKANFVGGWNGIDILMRCMLLALNKYVMVLLSLSVALENYRKIVFKASPFQGDFWFCIYCLRVWSGAPPTEATKYEGLHNEVLWGFLYPAAPYNLLETPLRWLTIWDTDSNGGFS